MIQNVIFGILFLKILFWACNFFIFVEMFPRTSSEFLFNFRFSSRKSQSQKTLLILRISTHLILQIICSRNTAKISFNFKGFPADMFLLGVRENICTAIFPDAQELTTKYFQSKCLYISVYLRKKIFVPRM